MKRLKNFGQFSNLFSHLSPNSFSGKGRKLWHVQPSFNFVRSSWNFYHGGLGYPPAVVLTVGVGVSVFTRLFQATYDDRFEQSLICSSSGNFRIPCSWRSPLFPKSSTYLKRRSKAFPSIFPVEGPAVLVLVDFYWNKQNMSFFCWNRMWGLIIQTNFWLSLCLSSYSGIFLMSYCMESSDCDVKWFSVSLSRVRTQLLGICPCVLCCSSSNVCDSGIWGDCSISSCATDSCSKAAMPSHSSNCSCSQRSISCISSQLYTSRNRSSITSSNWSSTVEGWGRVSLERSWSSYRSFRWYCCCWRYWLDICRRRIYFASCWCWPYVRLRRRRRATQWRVTISTFDWSKSSSGWLDGRISGDISWLIEASLWVSLLNGCEAELAISSWLIFILKQIADEKNSSSTISLSTCGKNRFLRLSQTTFDDCFEFGSKGVCLYENACFELFHLISVKY